MKILYIAGVNRSGSTILGKVLGQIKGFIDIGEANSIWDRGFKENWLCSCGKEFSKCDFWQTVIEVTKKKKKYEVEEVIEFKKKYLSTKGFMLSKLKGRDSPCISEILSVLKNFYISVQTVSSTRVIVDSSKNPIYGYFLKKIFGDKIFFVHLVRNPQGVCYSWRYRNKKRTDLGENRELRMNVMPYYRACINWSIQNFLSASLLKPNYMRLNYEDFVKHPFITIKKICFFIGETCDKNLISKDNKINLKKLSHSISGNPIRRVKEGSITIKPVDEWRYKTTPWERLVTLIFSSWLYKIF